MAECGDVRNDGFDPGSLSLQCLGPGEKLIQSMRHWASWGGHLISRKSVVSLDMWGENIKAVGLPAARQVYSTQRMRDSRQLVWNGDVHGDLLCLSTVQQYRCLIWGNFRKAMVFQMFGYKKKIWRYNYDPCSIDSEADVKLLQQILFLYSG